MRTILCGLMLLVAINVLAASKLQPLNVKIGIWEVSQTITSSGQMPVPPDVLARLNPEQRARVEEQMKANAAGKTRATTHKSCLTKEKLEKSPAFSDNPNCTWTVLTSTGSKVNVRGVCADHDIKSRITLQVEALNPESVKGASQGTVSGGDHTMNMNSTFVGKWLGSSCGSIK